MTPAKISNSATGAGTGGAIDKRRSLSIFVLIDALGWEYLKDREFLNDLLPWRFPLRTVLGFSSGAIPTILTGRTPAEHGHWNLFYYDPQASPFRWLRWFRFLPEWALGSRVSRKIVKELGRRVLGMGPLFECFVSPRLMPWFNWGEKRSIYESGGITGARSIFDRLCAQAIPYKVYSYHDMNDAAIVRQAQTDMQTGKASFYFLYLSEMDHFLHHHCQEPKRIDAELAIYSQRLRELLKSARTLDPEASLTIFSDHGMRPVTTHVNIAHRIDALGLELVRDYLVVYDSTMARFWFFNESAKERIAAELGKTECGRILSKPELDALGLGFPDNRYGDMIFLLNPGWLVSNSDFSSGGWQPLGMHGYHPDDPYSDAIFLSSRKPAVPVKTIADVHRCLLEAADA